MLRLVILQGKIGGAEHKLRDTKFPYFALKFVVRVDKEHGREQVSETKNRARHNRGHGVYEITGFSPSVGLSCTLSGYSVGGWLTWTESSGTTMEKSAEEMTDVCGGGVLSVL